MQSQDPIVIVRPDVLRADRIGRGEILYESSLGTDPTCNGVHGHLLRCLAGGIGQEQIQVASVAGELKNPRSVITLGPSYLVVNLITTLY